MLYLEQTFRQIKMPNKQTQSYSFIAPNFFSPETGGKKERINNTRKIGIKYSMRNLMCDAS